MASMSFLKPLLTVVPTTITKIKVTSAEIEALSLANTSFEVF